LKTHKLIAITGCTLFALAAAFAQTPPASQSLTDNPVFKKDCTGCHGKNAQGRFMAGPSLVSDKVAGASLDDLRGIITNGKGRMPKYTGKLTAEEIDTLAQEVKAANKK